MGIGWILLADINLLCIEIWGISNQCQPVAHTLYTTPIVVKRGAPYELVWEYIHMQGI